MNPQPDANPQSPTPHTPSVPNTIARVAFAVFLVFLILRHGARLEDWRANAWVVMLAMVLLAALVARFSLPAPGAWRNALSRLLPRR